MAKGDLFPLLGRLLTYPRPELSEAARRCGDLLAGEQPEAAQALQSFAACLDNAPERLEEVYAATFDLNPACCPYAAYHLFGDGPKRSALMLKLQDAYQERGFAASRELPGVLLPDNELPDHVALLLAFLPKLEGEAESDLRREVLAPALQKIAASLDASNPYSAVIGATLLAVQGEALAYPKGGASGV